MAAVFQNPPTCSRIQLPSFPLTQLIAGLHLWVAPETYIVTGVVAASEQQVVCSCKTQNHDPRVALEASLARLAEKMYLARHLPSPTLTHMEIYAKPNCRPYKTRIPLCIVRSHWVITKARSCLHH